LLFQVYSSCFYLSSKLKFFVMRKLVSKALTNFMAHLLSCTNKHDHCDSLMKFICLQIMSWELAHPCFHGARFQYCTYSY
jgi:hypothetical protein